MQRRIAELKDRHFDVLVVGAGITGAWIALDCAARGLAVAVVDKQDIGAGTSAKSSKLIHGGIRYLQQLRLDKVRESALERAYYHRAAPHLTHFVPFMVPTYRRFAKGRAFMGMGMSMYRMLCAGENEITADPSKRIPRPFSMSRGEVLQVLPVADPKLSGAQVYYESQMESSERMTLAVLDKADQLGAICANYVAAKDLLTGPDNRVQGMRVEDTAHGETFEIRAGMTVNATGPWISALNRTLLNDKSIVVSTGQCRGSHLVTRQLIKDYGVALSTQYAGQNVIDRGGRHIFILPWRRYSLIGTSYVAADDIENPAINREEVDQLLGEINRQLPQLGLAPRDVLYAFSGIYPLQEAVLKEQTYQGTGDYQIVDHASFGYDGIVSALGAKYTTARRVAERVTDLVVNKLRISAEPCATRTLRLSGADYEDLNSYTTEMIEALSPHVDESQTRRLLRQHGTHVERLRQCLERDPGLAKALCGSRPNMAVEVHHAVQSEMALTLEDVIYRRTGIGTVGYPDDRCINSCVSIMADLLGWDQPRCEQEVSGLERHRRFLAAVGPA